MLVVEADEFGTEADREGLDGDAVPARHEVVPHLVDEDDDRQHDEEGRQHVEELRRDGIKHELRPGTNTVTNGGSPPAMPAGAAMQRANQKHEDYAESNAVEPVHQPAVARE